MPAFKIEPYHKVILHQLNELDPALSSSVGAAGFAANLLSRAAVPQEHLSALVAGVEDLIRRMAENQAPFAARVTSILRVGFESLQNRRDPRFDADSALLAATGNAVGHGAGSGGNDLLASADYPGGHGEQGLIPIRSAFVDRGDGHGASKGCLFAAGTEAHAQHVAAPDPGTVVVRGFDGHGVARHVFRGH